ncbi:hypothetical protein D9615_005825 [Tricholomella constricta]|uniref:Uncharacterized protein n=1 Tax=Tricholomella constricta TaxID=117010 RepID=A0A8H5M3U3_9AGAR|nr:hypothetical protein D9615_005825 [Tricholomella constricta]
MTGMVDPKLIRDAIAAAQAEATSVPLRESNDGDEVTVHGVQDAAAAAAVDMPAFEGFTEFELDLSCLSPPPSPPASIYTDARSVSPTASPRTSTSRHSYSPTQSPGASPRTDTSPRLSPATANAAVRGSWPLMKYVGRGTPIDTNRRKEWSGVGSVEGVNENGVLFSAVRSTSLDSEAFHPSQRSVSPEWSVLNRRPSTLPSRHRSRSFAVELEPPTPSPEIQIEGLGADNPGEWASFMHTVLSGSSESDPAASTPASTSQLPAPVVEGEDASAERPVVADPPSAARPSLSPEEIRKLDTGIVMDLRIDAALDLALGYRGGMNLYDLDMLPGSGRESPSVYSSHPPSPCPSRPPSPAPSRPPSVTPLDHRSTTSTKDAALESKSHGGSQVWWKKMLRRLRRVHLLLGSH